MNLIYRSIWNDKTGTFVAVSENTRSAGKKAGYCTSAAGHSAGFALKALAASLLLSFGVSSYAQPVGGIVAAGAAGIASTAGKTTITQSTQNAVINWQSFGIAAGQSVQFLQPNSSSVALNRVLGTEPTAIFGSLSANGRVFLVNPGGILFGSGASVNVGGLVASTLNISDANFMAGRYIFSNPGNGNVVNQGTVQADGGYVALLGSNVSNQGTLTARLGTVALAAGNAVTLDMAGDKLLNVTVDQGAVNALVQNGGLVQANGGLVLITAQGAGNLLSTVVNNTGVIRAQTLSNINGTIKLLADAGSGTVNVAGTLDASGTGTGQTGGNVTATAHHVGLFGGRIDASGDAGGGTVLVGGGYQGQDASVQNASAAYTSADSSIHADAINTGNGGKVVLWSNDSTRAYGNITARGGNSSGNGGLIETSGHALDVTGVQINASAANGNNGTWLLDPADVTISAGPLSNATLTAGVFSPNSGQGSANINAGALQMLLNAGTDVTITTTNTGTAGVPLSGRGDINVNAPLTWTRTAAQTKTTLTLNAVGDVNINQTITATGGNLVVCCGRDITVASIPVGSRITTTNGSVLLSAGRDIFINGATTTTDGNFAMCAAHDINVNAPMTLTRGSVVAAESLTGSPYFIRQGLTFSAGTGATGPGLLGGGGAVNISPPGGVITVTQGGAPGTAAPVTIIYNPLSYALPVTDYTGNFTAGTPLTVRRLVFPGGADKTFDGTTAATFTSLKADSLGVTPTGVSLTGTGTFDTAAVGVGKLVTYSGLTLGGSSASSYALPADCCGPTIGTGRTTADITAAAPPPPPPPPPPPLLPVVVPPVVSIPPIVEIPPVVQVPPVVPVVVIPPVVQAPPLVPVAVIPPIVEIPPVVQVPLLTPVVVTPPVEVVEAKAVPPFLPPTIRALLAGTPLLQVTVASPPVVVLVQATPEKPAAKTVTVSPEVTLPAPAPAPLPYVAPVRPPKQGRQ